MAADRQAADQPTGTDHVIRIVVVDDDDLVRSGLVAILDLEPDIEVVGQGADGVDVPALVARSRPEVVVMDVRMPRVDGIAATARLTERPDGPAVVVITTFESDDAVHDALLAGARGFVLKRARPEDLLAAVRTVAHTDSLVFPDAIRRVAAARVRRPSRPGRNGSPRGNATSSPTWLAARPTPRSPSRSWCRWRPSRATFVPCWPSPDPGTAPSWWSGATRPAYSTRRYVQGGCTDRRR